MEFVIIWILAYSLLTKFFEWGAYVIYNFKYKLEHTFFGRWNLLMANIFFILKEIQYYYFSSYNNQTN